MPSHKHCGAGFGCFGQNCYHLNSHGLKAKIFKLHFSGKDAPDKDKQCLFLSHRAVRSSCVYGERAACVG